MQKSCDWCQGGAADLVFGEGISADIDEEDGVLRVYLRGDEVASRQINFCPMCGRPVGEVNPERVQTLFEDDI